MIGFCRASLLAIFLAVTVTACSSLSPILPPQQAAQARAERERAISAIEAWNLNGRISLRRDDEAWHASLLWHQIQDIFQIRIIAPLGQGGAQLAGSAHDVVLQTGDGEFRADSAERLLAEQFGWRLPIDGLRYWTLGLAAPGEVVSANYDETGYLAELNQAGWQIDYHGYTPVTTAVGTINLPGKIFLRRDGLEVRLVVDSWQVTSNGVAGQ